MPTSCLLGKSEVIKNNLNPNWVEVFILDYELGSTTKVAFSVFDEVRKGENKSMGSAIFDIAEVLASRGSTKGKNIRDGGTYVFGFMQRMLWNAILIVFVCHFSKLTTYAKFSNRGSDCTSTQGKAKAAAFCV